MCTLLFTYFICCSFRPEGDDDDEDDVDEFSDKDVNKILIVMQTPARPPKHEGYDRTGDYTSRVKMTQELEQTITDGLMHYQEDLWVDLDVSHYTKRYLHCTFL